MRRKGKKNANEIKFFMARRIYGDISVCMGIYLSVCVFKVAASPAPSLALSLLLCLSQSFFLSFCCCLWFLFVYFLHALLTASYPSPSPLYPALLSFDSFKFPMLCTSPPLTGPSLGHSCGLLPHHFDALERVFVVEFYLSLFNF